MTLEKIVEYIRWSGMYQSSLCISKHVVIWSASVVIWAASAFGRSSHTQHKREQKGSTHPSKVPDENSNRAYQH